MNGSIYQRVNKKTGKKDNWSYTAELGRDPITNKRKQVTKGGFENRSQAEAALMVFLNDKGNNEEFVESETTLNDFLNKWFEKFEYKPERKTSNIDALRFYASKLIQHFKDYLIKDITTEMYDEFLMQLNTKYSQNTCKAVHDFSMIIFKEAVNLKIIKNNPLKKYTQKTEKENL